MSFKGFVFFFWFFFFFFFFFFSSGGHFVQRQQGGTKEIFFEIILKSGCWARKRCRLNVLLFLALVAILFSGEEPF